MNRLTTPVKIRYKIRLQSRYVTIRDVTIPTTGSSVQVVVGDQIQFIPLNKRILLNGQTDFSVRANRTKFNVDITMKAMFKVQVNANNLIGTVAYLTWVADSKTSTGKYLYQLSGKGAGRIFS